MRPRWNTALIPALPPRGYRSRLGLLAVLAQLTIPAALLAQGGADSLAVPGVRWPAAFGPRLVRPPTGPFTPLGLLMLRDVPSVTLAATWRSYLEQALADHERARWRAAVFRARDGGTAVAELTSREMQLLDSLAAVEADTGIAAVLGQLLGSRADLGLQMLGRLEASVDRSRNERCTTGQFFALASQCAAGYQPAFDFNFRINTGGVVAERLHINVDYDSEREFDASNNISVFYQGKTDELFQRIEVGNVSLDLPPSQFITSGIPQGNYGIQGIGQFGPAQFRTMFAQQRGNVPKTYTVMVGDRTVKQENRDLEDYQIEPRRFFFTVDPLLFGSAYPNLDVLNATQMRALAEALPETQRPRKLSVYRLLIGGQPPNPNGPRFALIGDPNSRAGQVYELLRENQDYYTDPSLLWIALARNLNLQNERLVIAYTLRVGGRDTVIAELGGTPDVSFVPDRPQLAHLLWDPQVRPGEVAFRREIRAFYRVAGEDLRRQSVSVRVTTGGGLGQEKPLAGTSETYLQMFGLSQSGNAALFDVENRLWPRTGDPNVAVGGGRTKIINDYYLVLPSARAFARDGLVQPGNPATDTVYTTPNEDLYSAQHPQSNYRILMRYDIEGGGEVGSVALGAGQLRRFSEIVTVENIVLTRDDGAGGDYTIDYDLGRISFSRPDTLFPRPRPVAVRYEENPLFAAAPTSIMAFATQIPMERGALGFTAIAQRQSTAFTRPPLGYEPQSSLITGVNGRFSFDAAPVSRLLERIPTVRSTSLSRFDLQGEFAMSRPQPNSAGQAYVESFEGEGALNVPLIDAAWFYSSQPALGARLPQRLGAETFGLIRASTMAWQNAAQSRAGFPIQFNITQIDPQVQLSGSGINAQETILWLTLYPLSTGGLFSDRRDDYQWKIEDPLPGRRWRSVRTALSPSGVDLSRMEMMEFWTLADTSLAGIATNPTIVIDLGDVSENSVAFGPTTLTVTPVSPGVNDSAYTGKALIGLDELDSERDSVSRGFNQAIDDKGIPGDVIPQLAVFTPEGFDIASNFATCARGAFRLLFLGDSRNNCTVQNGRLDEEDIDLDNTLNFTETQRESERVRRYIVDLSVRAAFNRVGKCSIAIFDTAGGGTVTQSPLCWVQVRVPFRAADDSLNGGPNIRRVRALRMTVVSGPAAADTAFTLLPFARFRFIGSPLVKRSDRTVRGIAGDAPALGFTIASVIGTQDRDTLRNLDYEPPPGVTDAAERQQTGLENLQTQINERSLRLLAGGLEPFDRAEAFFRFAEGPKMFMNYRELRVWARGRGNGWGADGELQFYIKIGRDQNNFYLFRTPVNAGPGRAAWLPEVRVDFDKLFALRAELFNNTLEVGPDSIACTGVDSVLIARSGLPVGQPINRHAVCSEGYMVYSVDPAVNPPSLSQVQEIAVGMVRVAAGTGSAPIMLADTLELWVDDIRLTDVEATPGYAGTIGFSLLAGDVANVRMNLTRRDGHFRQLAEEPSFINSDGFDVSSFVRLERLLPGASGYSLPLTISHSRGGSEPIFLSQSDIPGGGIDNLRTPRSDVTNFNLNVRRVAPLTGSLWGGLVNNLSGNATVARANSRTEFTEGGSSVWTAGMDYSVQANARFAQLPRWLEAVLMRGSQDPRIRWNPTQFRLSSQLGHTSDRRLSFSKPAAVLSDTGRRVEGLTYVWRTQSGFELRPVSSLSANWSFSTVRDLRNYGDTSAAAIVASGEREKLLGLDVGLERERQMNAGIVFTPAVTPWLRPSVSLGSSYNMQRDPQTRQLVRTGDSTGAFRLPRRLNSIQTIAAGTNFDPARAIKAWRGETGRVARVADVFQQLDVEYSRSYVSAFDGAPFTPGIGYQFALGGIDAFRRLEGFAAASAGSTEQITLSTGFRLPLEMALTTRAQSATSRNYTRRLDNTQALIEGKQTRFPDASLRWTGAPRILQPLVSTISLNAGYLHTTQLTFVPSETPDAPGDRRSLLVWSYPIQSAITWNLGGTLITSFGLALQNRVDSVPGSVTESNSRGMSADVSRTFALPLKSSARGGLRTRVNWQNEVSTSYVSVEGSLERRRLADNGHHTISINAETALAPNLLFLLQGSRTVRFDNNYNQRFSRLVFSMVFTLQYQAGELR